MVLLGLPQPDAGTWLARLASPPAPVPTTPRRTIMFTYEFAVDQARQVTDRQTVPIAYRYVLFDENGSEILAYHWHPTGASPVTTPHLHVSARRGDLDLSPAHLPTGVVSPIA